MPDIVARINEETIVKIYQSTPVDEPAPLGVTLNGSPKGFIRLEITTGKSLNIPKIPIAVENNGIYFLGASHCMERAKHISIGNWYLSRSSVVVKCKGRIPSQRYAIGIISIINLVVG